MDWLKGKYGLSCNLSLKPIHWSVSWLIISPDFSCKANRVETEYLDKKIDHSLSPDRSWCCSSSHQYWKITSVVAAFWLWYDGILQQYVSKWIQISISNSLSQTWFNVSFGFAEKSPEESAKHLPGPHLQEHPTARRAVAEGYRGPDQGAQLFKHHETMAIRGLNPPKWFFTMKNYGLNPAHQK